MKSALVARAVSSPALALTVAAMVVLTPTSGIAVADGATTAPPLAPWQRS